MTLRKANVRFFILREIVLPTALSWGGRSARRRGHDLTVDGTERSCRRVGTRDALHPAMSNFRIATILALVSACTTSATSGSELAGSSTYRDAATDHAGA